MKRIAVYFVGLFAVAGLGAGVSAWINLSEGNSYGWGLFIGGLYGWAFAPWVFRGRTL